MKIIKFLVAIGVTILLSSAPLVAQDDPRGREIGSGISPETNGIFFNNDGSRLVIVDANAVQVLDVASGDKIEKVWQRRAIMSDGGRLMATYGSGGQLEIRDVATGVILHKFAYSRAYETARPMFVADDTQLLAGWRDSRTVLIDVESGEVIAEFRLDQQTTLYDPVGLSADGQWIVTGRNGSYLIWALEGGPVRTFTSAGGWSSGQLDGRGNLVVSAENQDYLAVIPLEPGEPVRRIDLGQKSYTSMTINTEGTLAVLESRRAGAVVDLEAELLAYNLGPRLGSEIKSVKFSPDGSMIAIGRAYGAAFLIDARTGAFRGLHVPHVQTPVQALAFSPDGAFIVSSSTREMRIWPVATALVARPPVAAQYCVDANIDTSGGSALAALPDGQIFLNRYGSLHFISRETGTSEAFMEDIEIKVTSIGVSRDLRTLFAVLEDNSIEIRSTETGRRVTVLGPHFNKLRDVVLASDGTRVVTMDRGDQATLWDATTGEGLLFFSNPEYPIYAVALNLYEPTVALASGNLLMFYNTANSEYITEYKFEDDTDGSDLDIRYIRFLPEGRVLAASKDGEIVVFDWQTGENFVTFDVEIESRLDFLEVSLDGQTFVHDDGRFAVLREMATGNEIQRFAHDITIDAAQYDPEGARLLTAAGDSTLRLWSLETGEELARYVGHRGIIEEIGFLPSGAGVMSAGLDRNICVYNLPQD